MKVELRYIVRDPKELVLQYRQEYNAYVGGYNGPTIPFVPKWGAWQDVPIVAESAMSPEKQANIERLAEALYKARLKKDSLASRNISGRSIEEGIAMEKEYQVAYSEYLDAVANLEAAQKP